MPKLSAIVLAAVWAATMSGSATAPAAEVRVSAAVSLTEALEEIAAGYRTAGGATVVFNFGPSNTLARQIERGAPADLFISADEQQMQGLERAGLVEAREVVPLLSNTLAIVVPDDSPLEIRSARDLASPGIRRIAIGDPAGVPAGVYARQYLERLGLWTSLAPKLVPSTSVRGALTAVASGSVDAGIVYKTDASATRRVRLAMEIARSDGPAIVYPAAVVKGGTNPEGARKVLAYLRSPRARSTFQKHGFIPL